MTKNKTTVRLKLDRKCGNVLKSFSQSKFNESKLNLEDDLLASKLSADRMPYDKFHVHQQHCFT